MFLLTTGAFLLWLLYFSIKNGVDAKTGLFLWRYAEVAKGPAQYFTPVARDGYVYGGALGVGGGLVRLKSDGTGVTAEPVYFARTSKQHWWSRAGW